MNYSRPDVTQDGQHPRPLYPACEFLSTIVNQADWPNSASSVTQLISNSLLKPITVKPSRSLATAAHVETGVPIPKGLRVRAFSPEEWEAFIEEWASTLEAKYVKVRRFGGAGDLGVDIAGLSSAQGLLGPWDNYQCKRYDHPLRPSDIWVEIGKVIYYSSTGEYAPPLHHYFVCSQDIGTTLEQLLNNTPKLKEQAKANWEKHCRHEIGANLDLPLEGTLADSFDKFDFTIFSSQSVLDLINAHAKSQYHAVRFGGGLPLRPASGTPPANPAAHESRYVRQLLDAYGDRDGMAYADPSALAASPATRSDFLRQRERFYHAESLRNFARDTVPEGTFDDLQDEIFHGIIDVCEGDHANGFDRMRATINQAVALPGFSNPLNPALKTQDRQGICHQLANDDRITWVDGHD